MSQEYEILGDDESVINVINAAAEFVEQRYPGQYRLREDPLQAAARPVLVITDITASTAEAMIDLAAAEVTCPAGTSLTVTAELRDANGLIPLDATFRMPIRARDGRERMLLAAFSSGITTISAPMRESGMWTVTEQLINGQLPPDQQMQFGGITIYVTEA